MSLAELTLVIWSENPEDIRLYLIPNEVSQKYRDFLDQAHDRMINVDDMNDGLNFLNAAIYNKEDCSDQAFKQYGGIFIPYEYKHSANPITGVNITRVYKSGFLL